MAVAQKKVLVRSSLARPLHGPTLAFDLDAEVEALRKEAEWRATGRNARTLAKYPDTRIVLEVMKKGTRFAPNGPSERLTLQCLHGRVRVHVPTGRHVEVKAGALCTLDRFMANQIEALADSACLLFVSWPPSA
ncbi:MAG TPA: hypothetical protein VFP50_11165 [Anaeromyxobacteraceae bacterium]|nr:hypothetical protein [Anaeromyxobacteraceae bacterium]